MAVWTGIDYERTTDRPGCLLMEIVDRSFEREGHSVFDARFDAQRIAFAPVVFQVVLVLRREGILQGLVEARGDGLSVEQIQASCGLSEYALTVLLECAQSAAIVNAVNGRYVITKTGFFLERDELTRVNMDFVADVCYAALAHLGTSLREGRPAGLPELGTSWKTTVYEDLSLLPEPARSSWFAFDHFYSDSAFPAALEILSREGIGRLADVGANTGRFATAFLTRNPGVHVTLVDLPPQLALAQANLTEAGLLDRAAFHRCDVTAAEITLPEGVDAFWMSQFLCCFSEDQIVAILARAASCLPEGGSVYVLDTFWDKQKFDIAAYCLINTSPYFAAVANGNSRMYKAIDLVVLAGRAGLRLVQTWEDLGWSHTLLKLSR